jgi:hypothetical protein
MTGSAAKQQRVEGAVGSCPYRFFVSERRLRSAVHFALGFESCLRQSL